MNSTRTRKNRQWILAIILSLFPSLITAQSQRESRDVINDSWRTNTDKRSIELSELISPDMPKDGIPVIDHPAFMPIRDARLWLGDNEPVIALQVGKINRACPLQILLWHEVANDQIGQVPVAVTFCSLCHSALVFDRRVGDRILSFGISGLIRRADMVLYDRETESWWQQFTGEALVGDLTGSKLKQLPAQIVSFAQFSAAFPEGEVLSRETGYRRNYGHNHHVAYDDLGGKPLHFRGKTDTRLPAMERVIGVEFGDQAKAYPYSVTRARNVIYDLIGRQEIVIFHGDGALSALDAEETGKSREVGSTGVFDPQVDGRRLRFRYEGGQFIDEETKSSWNILGQAVSGKLRGKSLTPITHGDYFAFAWFAFKPASLVFAA